MRRLEQDVRRREEIERNGERGGGDADETPDQVRRLVQPLPVAVGESRIVNGALLAANQRVDEIAEGEPVGHPSRLVQLLQRLADLPEVLRPHVGIVADRGAHVLLVVAVLDRRWRDLLGDAELEVVLPARGDERKRGDLRLPLFLAQRVPMIDVAALVEECVARHGVAAAAIRQQLSDVDLPRRAQKVDQTRRIERRVRDLDVQGRNRPGR